MKTQVNVAPNEAQQDVVVLGSVSGDTHGDGMGVEPNGIGKFPPGVISEN